MISQPQALGVRGCWQGQADLGQSLGKVKGTAHNTGSLAKEAELVNVCSQLNKSEADKPSVANP